MSTQKVVEKSTKSWSWYYNPVDRHLSVGERLRAAKIDEKYSKEKEKLFPRRALEDMKTLLLVAKDTNIGDSGPIYDMQNYVDGSKRPIRLNLGLDGDT